MSKKNTLEEQIQNAHFTLLDVQKKALNEYDQIKNRHDNSQTSLEDQVIIAGMLEKMMKMVVDSTGKQIELLKVLERSKRVIEAENGDDGNKTNKPINIPNDQLMKQIRAEIGEERNASS